MLQKIQQSSHYRDTKHFIKQHEQLLLPAMLLAGVAVDFVTFRTIQITTVFIVLGIHFLILGSAIALSHISPANLLTRYLHTLSPLALQFSLGALLSASLIFYWYSGTFSVSWPILGLIALLMVSNEVFRSYFKKPTIQIGVYFFATFSVLILILPHLFRSIRISMFLFAGVISLTVIYVYMRCVGNRIKEIEKEKTSIARAVVSIFIIMNLAYALNLIPPIPLSLTDAGIYHNITRTNGGYLLEQETETIFQTIIPGQTVTAQEGTSVYAFASIFAPTDLHTRIYHRWQWYDETSKEWTTLTRPSYTISGGRANGYRGFSRTSQLKNGAWRVNIETEDGRIIGRIHFTMRVEDMAPPTHIISK